VGFVVVLLVALGLNQFAGWLDSLDKLPEWIIKSVYIIESALFVIDIIVFSIVILIEAWSLICEVWAIHKGRQEGR
jgi:hypothetical protein